MPTLTDIAARRTPLDTPSRQAIGAPGAFPFAFREGADPATWDVLATHEIVGGDGRVFVTSTGDTLPGTTEGWLVDLHAAWSLQALRAGRATCSQGGGGRPCGPCQALLEALRE